MRAILVALLVVGSALLAGCAKPDESNAAAVTNPTTSSTGGGGSAGTTTASAIRPLPPIAVKAKTIDRDWFQPGEAIPLAGDRVPGLNSNVVGWAVGALPGTVAVTPANVDTGSKSGAEYIAPNATKAVTFKAAGIYTMHCHPHPYMMSNVSVVEGAKATKADVYIFDGASQKDSLYFPDNVVIAPGGTVTYHNMGQAPHTATQSAQSPPVKLALAKDFGEVKIDSKGWHRLYYLVEAASTSGPARTALATIDVYVAPFPTFETVKAPVDVPVAGLPAGVDSTVTKAFDLAHNGTLNVTVALEDAAAANGAPASITEVEVTITNAAKEKVFSTTKLTDALSGPAPAGSYVLTIVVKQGAGVGGSVSVDAVYDTLKLTPPAPVIAGGHDDGHGDHGGH